MHFYDDNRIVAQSHTNTRVTMCVINMIVQYHNIIYIIFKHSVNFFNTEYITVLAGLICKHINLNNSYLSHDTNT